jgi:predicted transcriptional regulator
MEEKRTVQSIARAMRVLEVLNRVDVVQVEQLHRDTELPKSTLIRILETLTECGYVFQVSRRAGYSLTEKALRLSSGVRNDDAPMGPPNLEPPGGRAIVPKPTERFTFTRPQKSP